MAKYYNTQLGRAFSTAGVRSNFGFDPTNYDQNVLISQYNLYLVNEVPFPRFDTNLYSRATATYIINVDGVTYDESYVLTQRSLVDAQTRTLAKLKDEAEYDSIVALGGTAVMTRDAGPFDPVFQEVSYPAGSAAPDPDTVFDPYGPYEQSGGESPTLFTAQSYLAAASRIEPYKTIATNINAIATTLDTTVAAVNAATDIAGVKSAYRPTTGDIDITRSGNNITSATFNTLVNAEFSEMVLVIVSTGYIMYYDENNGGFTALGGQLPAGAADVVLYVGDISLATFTIPSGNGTTNFTF